MKKKAYLIKEHLKEGVGNTKNAENFLGDMYPTETTTTYYDDDYEICFITSDPKAIEIMIDNAVQFNKCKLAEKIKKELTKKELLKMFEGSDEKSVSYSMQAALYE